MPYKRKRLFKAGWPILKPSARFKTVHIAKRSVTWTQLVSAVANLVVLCKVCSYKIKTTYLQCGLHVC